MGIAEIGRDSTEIETPGLEVAGLRIWLHRRQFPAAHDPDEGNLICATIRCDSEEVSVRTDEASIRASDIARWARDCRALLKGTTALARFSLKKGVFEIVLLAAPEDLSRIVLRVAVVPGEGARGHSFEFQLERGGLETIIRQCDEMVAAFPVRGASLIDSV